MPENRSKGPRLAEELFLSNYNCAQSTLAGILSECGWEYDDRMKLAGAFGGGIAHTGGLCGALTGAFMAFGMLTPMKDDIGAWKAEVSLMSKELMSRFKEEFAETSCSKLAGCNMALESKRKAFHDDGGRDRICTPMVRRSVEMALLLLKERK